MQYRTFHRRWWADKACTIPKLGRRTYDGGVYNTEADARAACAAENAKRTGGPKPGRGPYGAATEYEAF